ncbi:hypothetical protein GGS23DRAFT_606578 [Durotheca rogersii]|uniref:uncharacterized protein n=1 Tax=Durotheca rogersii TaxID=419775 RepID=UPI002220CFE4|nr:uncharacterized protein GGS23DRAFT_606578 [Durotheca rogersii]KAI5860794.1 hypothetical protein GGS23DRAFT_606578 [Durotheca rogersii]
MAALYDFYAKREQTKKGRAVWAAINIVVAIGYRIRTTENADITVAFDNEKVLRCIDNARSVLEELVTREEDTLGIQVLLGLVILFQADTDQKPSSMLIGTAVRLAHRLQLHAKSSLSNFAPDVARHRSNIFWLCYSLDKDVSLRTKVPSVQQDEDIDLDLPGAAPEDDGAYFKGVDGRSQFHYLRARVQLASLEGKTYDWLISNRSAKLSLEARQEKLLLLSRLLVQWRQTIPESLQPDRMADNLEKAPLIHMTYLYHTYMLCLIHANGLYSVDSSWIRWISRSSRAMFHDFDAQENVSMKHHQPLLPHAWEACVQVSRACLKMLPDELITGYNIWLNGCAYFSAFVVLLINVVYYPLHELVQNDRELATSGMGRIRKLLEHTRSESHKELYIVLVDLGRAADYAPDRAWEATTGPSQWGASDYHNPRAEHSIVSKWHHDIGRESTLVLDLEAGPVYIPFMNPPAALFLPSTITATRILLKHRIPLQSFLAHPVRSLSRSAYRAMPQFKLRDVTSLSLQPGDKQEVEVEGIEGAKVLLLNAGGKIQATGPKCTHYGAPLVKGVLTKAGRLTCPWHGACFNVQTGDVEDAPALDALQVFKVVEKDGSVYVEGEEGAIKSGRRKPNFKCSASSRPLENRVVVVGGGSGAIGAIEGLREKRFTGPITMISKEGYLPIDRPKLSKALIADPTKIQLRDHEWFKSGSVEIVDDEVVDIDLVNKVAITKNNERHVYSKLILATGGSPRNLPLPGFKVLENIFPLRTVHDTKRIVDAIGSKGKKIVIIGSSFIGMEVANATAADNDVTVVGQESVPLERVLGKDVGAGLQKGLEGKGIKFHLSAAVDKAEPSGSDPSKVGSVYLKDGTQLAADLVILGVGVAPSTEYLKENKAVRLEADGSLKTDENFLVAGLEDVYAVGDIASFPYRGPGGEGALARIEHWNVAQNQGRAAARHIANPALAPAFFLPVFWSALTGQLRYCGNPARGWDDLVLQGDPSAAKFVAYYCRGETVVAMASMGADPAMAQSAELMTLGAMPSKTELRAGLDILTVPLP